MLYYSYQIKWTVLILKYFHTILCITYENFLNGLFLEIVVSRSLAANFRWYPRLVASQTTISGYVPQLGHVEPSSQENSRRFKNAYQEDLNLSLIHI